MEVCQSTNKIIGFQTEVHKKPDTHGTFFSFPPSPFFSWGLSIWSGWTWIHDLLPQPPECWDYTMWNCTCLFPLFLFLFCGAGGRTEGLTHTRQVFHWCVTSPTAGTRFSTVKHKLKQDRDSNLMSDKTFPGEKQHKSLRDCYTSEKGRRQKKA
jgi:hypothetical protein